MKESLNYTPVQIVYAINLFGINTKVSGVSMFVTGDYEQYLAHNVFKGFMIIFVPNATSLTAMFH